MIDIIHDHGSSFKGLLTYLRHDLGHAKTSERVAWTHTHNLATDNLDVALRIMIATARQASRLKAKAGIPNTGRQTHKHVMHYTISWHPDERETLTQAEMIRAAKQSLEYIGTYQGEPVAKNKMSTRSQYADSHQAVFVSHDDGPGRAPHVHVMVNRVHPELGTILPSTFDRQKLSAWAYEYRHERQELQYCPARHFNVQKRATGFRVRPEHRRRARRLLQSEEAQTLSSSLADVFTLETNRFPMSDRANSPSPVGPDFDAAAPGQVANDNHSPPETTEEDRDTRRYSTPAPQLNPPGVWGPQPQRVDPVEQVASQPSSAADSRLPHPDLGRDFDRAAPLPADRLSAREQFFYDLNHETDRQLAALDLSKIERRREERLVRARIEHADHSDAAHAAEQAEKEYRREVKEARNKILRWAGEHRAAFMIQEAEERRSAELEQAQALHQDDQAALDTAIEQISLNYDIAHAAARNEIPGITAPTEQQIREIHERRVQGNRVEQHGPTAAAFAHSATLRHESSTLEPPESPASPLTVADASPLPDVRTPRETMQDPEPTPIQPGQEADDIHGHLADNRQESAASQARTLHDLGLEAHKALIETELQRRDVENQARARQDAQQRERELQLRSDQEARQHQQELRARAKQEAQRREQETRLRTDQEAQQREQQLDAQAEREARERKPELPATEQEREPAQATERNQEDNVVQDGPDPDAAALTSQHDLVKKELQSRDHAAELTREKQRAETEAVNARQVQSERERAQRHAAMEAFVSQQAFAQSQQEEQAPENQAVITPAVEAETEAPDPESDKQTERQAAMEAFANQQAFAQNQEQQPKNQVVISPVQDDATDTPEPKLDKQRERQSAMQAFVGSMTQDEQQADATSDSSTDSTEGMTGAREAAMDAFVDGASSVPGETQGEGMSGE